MALFSSFSSSFLHSTFLFHSPLQHRFASSPSTKASSSSNGSLTKTHLSIKSQNSTTGAEHTNEPAPPKKPALSGLGFGSLSSPSTKSAGTGVGNSKKKQKGKRERASIIRRSPIERPAAFISKEDKAKVNEQNKNESVFLLAWLVLGALILIDGIVLAASGFLPEKWDKFFVEYLYPSFTPTVVLFVAGTVAYGVLKYLQNEKLKDQK